MFTGHYMADENKRKEKKPLRNRLKYAMLVSVILFFIGGFLFPILYAASFSLPRFIMGGLFSITIMWISIVIGHYCMEI